VCVPNEGPLQLQQVLKLTGPMQPENARQGGWEGVGEGGAGVGGAGVGWW